MNEQIKQTALNAANSIADDFFNWVDKVTPELQLGSR